MTPPRRPRRRLPARVYWFRRVMVLCVLLGLVVGVAQLLGRTDDTGEPAQARAVGGAPSSDRVAGLPTSTSDARPALEADATKKPRAKRTRTPLPQPTGPCVDEDIVVTPEVVGTPYAGSAVTLRLNISTLASPACTWQVSPRTVAVKLVSGSDRIWSSQDCPAAVPELEVVARKQKAATVDMTWRGQRSDSSCSRTTPWAQPGWYHVEAAAFGAEPSDVQFELRAPVAETITPKPRPEKSKKAGAEGSQRRRD